MKPFLFFECTWPQFLLCKVSGKSHGMEEHPFPFSTMRYVGVGPIHLILLWGSGRVEPLISSNFERRNHCNIHTPHCIIPDVWILVQKIYFFCLSALQSTDHVHYFLHFQREPIQSPTFQCTRPVSNTCFCFVQYWKRHLRLRVAKFNFSYISSQEIRV